MVDNLGILFDRSRVEDYEKCPRLRFWKSEYKGLGVTRRDIIKWELELGNAIHTAIEYITLKGANVGEAIAQGYTKYFTPIIALIEAEQDDQRRTLLNTDFKANYELLVAIAHAWAEYLPTYLSEYEPIEMEREELLTMDVGGQTITLMARADILSKRKVDGGLLIHNLKSVGNPNKQWQDQWAKDQQTLTELMAVETRVGKRIDGVVIVGLCKGRKNEWPKGSGNWYNDSPLTFCWHKRGEPPAVEDEFYAKYEWVCNEPHKMKNGRKCDGGRSHRLSGVYKARVSEVYPGGIEAWIQYLKQEEPDVLRQQIISITPIMRNEWEFERWKRMVVPRELDIVTHGKQVMSEQDSEMQLALLDHFFPMHTGHGNCIRPYTCEMVDICWGSDNPENQPERYRPRVPNHEAELVRISGTPR